MAKAAARKRSAPPPSGPIAPAHETADSRGLEPVADFELGHQRDVHREIDLGEKSQLLRRQVELHVEEAVAYRRRAQAQECLAQAIAVARLDRTENYGLAVRQLLPIAVIGGNLSHGIMLPIPMLRCNNRFSCQPAQNIRRQRRYLWQPLQLPDRRPRPK